MAEPNNNIAGAQTFNLETIYKDNIATDSDVDYFKIAPVNTPSQVTINFTGLTSTTNNNEFNISIRDASDTVIASTIKGLSTTLQASINKDAPYYLRVAKGSNLAKDEYSVKGSIIATAEAAGEKNVNDTITNINNATVLVPNADFTGYLGSSSAANGSDIDHYSFTTGTVVGSTIKIDVSSFAKDADFYTASVVDKNGTVVKKGITPVTKTVGTTQKQTLDFTVTESSGATPAGTYFLKINAINASNFESSSEKTKPYTIKLYGTTDYNQAPSVSISGVKSGLYGTANVENTTAKTVTKDKKVKLSDFIVATDPDTDTANKTIKEYYIGHIDTTAAGSGKDGKITYTADDTSSKTITTKTSTSATGFLQKLTATEFATAEYVGANADEVGQQSIYALVVDSSGTNVPDAIQRSGMVFQKIDTRDISVTVESNKGGATPNVALKEGQKDSGAGDGSDFQTLTFTLKGGTKDVNVSIVVNPGDDLELDSTTAPNNTVILSNVTGNSAATKDVKVWAKSDSSIEGDEKATMSFTTTSSDAKYKGLTVSNLVFDVNEVKAKFVVSDLVYEAASGVSEAATVNAGANFVLEGELASGGSVAFSSPHEIIITSAGDDSTRTFKVTGTDKNGTSQTEDITGANKGVAKGKKEFKTVTKIELVAGKGNTADKVHAGIESLLEGDATAGTDEATYTITASEFPAGKTLTVSMTSPDLTITTGSTTNPTHDFTANGSVTVKVKAKQDNLDELNPEEAIITTAVLEDSKVSALYSNSISNIKVNVEDSNKPIGTDSVVTGEKDKVLTFKTGDFGYSDPDGNSLSKITITDITGIPTGATLKNKAGADVKKDDVINAADISSLKFTPETGKGGVGYGTFKFKVNDGSEDAASANTMKINVGKSVAVNLQFWHKGGGTDYKKIKSTKIDTFKDKDGKDVTGGPFTTDSDGKIDLTGVPNGKYTAGYKAASSDINTKIGEAIDVLDILEIAKYMGGLKTFTNGEKVAANIDTTTSGSETAIDVMDILAIAKIMGGLTKHEDLGDQFVLRDNAQSDPFTVNQFEVEAPSALTLDSYLLGDVDGSFATKIA